MIDNTFGSTHSPAVFVHSDGSRVWAFVGSMTEVRSSWDGNWEATKLDAHGGCAGGKAAHTGTDWRVGVPTVTTMKATHCSDRPAVHVYV